VLAWFLNLVYVAILCAASPLIVFRMLVRGKYRTGWGQKLLGRVPRRTGAGRCLWFHAVSVGEVLQLEPLFEMLLGRDPALEIVISTTTATGFDLARKYYPGRQVFYFPLDFSWAVTAALERIRPTAIGLVELELWPNFILAAARRRVPLMLINGRMGEKSFRGYRRIRPLVRRIVQKFNALAVQSDDYARRLIALGAEPSRVEVTGSIKFDRVETDRANSRTDELRRAFGLAPAETVFIAGSTQEPEERYALESYSQLRPRFPGLRLILVPRHKERFEAVARLVEDEFGLPLLRRSKSRQRLGGSAFPGGAWERECSEKEASRDASAVILLDTLGELSACWGLAQIAFVGGSLTRRGGQNMIEPAGYGAGVLFGPNTWNFKDVVELLLAEDAALIVRTPLELTARLEELLADPTRGAELGERAQRLVAVQRGAAALTVDLIIRHLPPPADPAKRAA
jgi:3-deoxy-D-manno-octulosonic-acid transferase